MIRAAALAAVLVVLVGCDDQNDRRIETFKACQEAGMATREGSNFYGALRLYCTVPKVEP